MNFLVGEQNHSSGLGKTIRPRPEGRQEIVFGFWATLRRRGKAHLKGAFHARQTGVALPCGLRCPYHHPLNRFRPSALSCKARPHHGRAGGQRPSCGSGPGRCWPPMRTTLPSDQIDAQREPRQDEADFRDSYAGMRLRLE